LQELVPKAVRVGLLVNSRAPNSEAVTRDLQAAASAIGVELVTVGASDSREIDAAFLTLAGKRVAALVVGTRRLLLRPACPDHHPRDAPWSAKYLQREGLCGSRWSDDLWYELDGGLPSGRCLCRSHPQRREACRLAGGSIEQIRVHHQPSDRTSPRPRRAGHTARPRRRGDRVTRFRYLLHLLRSPIGTWPTRSDVRDHGEYWRVSGPSAKCSGHFVRGVPRQLDLNRYGAERPRRAVASGLRTPAWRRARQSSPLASRRRTPDGE